MVTIFQCLCMKYKNTWKSELFNDKRHNSCGNKLRTYRLFKDQFVFEPYLNWGTYNQRNILLNFVLAHINLRLKKEDIWIFQLKKRICRLCKLDVENKIHFLLECPSLANTRREILDQIESRFSNLKFLDIKSKFVWLLSADDHYIYNQLYALLTKLYNKRNDILSSNTH